MIKIENLEVFNFAGAIRGMRNPLNSWNKSDTVLGTVYKLYDGTEITNNDGFSLGQNDLELMRKLYNAGSEHAKYLRQIFVSFDVVAPLYWWKEFDTYKVGTTSNSCSTMHKLHSNNLSFEDFSHDHLDDLAISEMRNLINLLNYFRIKYAETNDKRYWWQMIQLLPSSYNQRRTITMSYANLVNIINQRKNHKLDEWKEFCEYMLENAVYLKEIMEG